MEIRNYILITPCKNEEKNLRKLAESVIKQTIKPKLWVIVDDGSIDNSPQILQELIEENSWIETRRLEEWKRDLGIHVSMVYRAGFQYAIDRCKQNNIEFEYIGIVDSDMILQNNYFEYLINKFEKRSNLGIASGIVGNIVKSEIIMESFYEDLPTGGARLWRKKCFEDTGGYLLTCSPDSVSIVKAKLRGWKTKRFKEIKAISTRPYASAEGQWIGYKKNGANNYFIGYTPIHIILKGIKLLYSKNGYSKPGMGIAYMIGYFKNYLRNAPRIEDKEIIEYYENIISKRICSKINSRRITK